MKNNIRLLRIPSNIYEDYRYQVIFKAFKWDPQVGDTNTISEDIVVLNRETALELANLAEELSKETLAMEEELLTTPHLQKELGLPKAILKELKNQTNYKQDEHIRLMRFDFHPTEDGWAISEVNSDVPGGLAEASILPILANKLYPNYVPYGDVIERIVNSIQSKIVKNGTVGFVHATSYSDDRQVMEAVNHYLKKQGINAVMIAPNHIKWIGDEAYSIASHQEGKLDAIIRFYPGEWLSFLPKKHWKRFFHSRTPSVNHPVALLTQSKRLPLIWDQLKSSNSTWKSLLPETRHSKTTHIKQEEWIYKPVLGRVGEGISIKEVIDQKEMAYIQQSARKYPKDWVLQKRFNNLKLLTENNEERYLCIGVFTVSGTFAGFYGRISSYPRIDSNAQDIAILVSNEEENHE